MTGRLRLGKISIFIRDTARILPSTMAKTATITDTGCLNAKTIGFIGAMPRRAQTLGLRLTLYYIMPASRAEEMLPSLETSNSSAFAPFVPDGPEHGSAGIERGYLLVGRFGVTG